LRRIKLMAKTKHNTGIDLIKGLLVILVILGHILLGKLNENLARFIIYGFHMPIFVAISGYLINHNNLQKSQLKDLFIKYKYRIIVPWAIAVIGYAIVTNDNYNLTNLIVIFVKPYYHLWYIPAILTYIFFTWLLTRLKIEFNKIVILGIMVISLLSYMAYILPALISSTPIKAALSLIRPQFYVFFYLGFYLKSNSNFMQIKRGIYLAILPIALIAYIACFFVPNTLLFIVSFFSLNFFLTIFLLRKVTSERTPRIPLLEWMGQNSLAIYLWHVVPLLVLKKLSILTDNIWAYYVACVIAEALVLGSIFLLMRVKQVNQYVFGNFVKANTNQA
jgi:acyltransferase